MVLKILAILDTAKAGPSLKKNLMKYLEVLLSLDMQYFLLVMIKKLL